MQKLLVIGAGIGQVPILEKAKKRGLYTVAVTTPGDWPGIPIADETWYLDIYEREAIAERAKREGITAVISDQNDLMNPTVAYVAEKLGLPGNRFEDVMRFCDKNRFREYCKACGVPGPKHIAVTDPDFDGSAFDAPLPWIVKPADSQSSIGVKKIGSREELRAALKPAIEHSVTKTAILEQFFTGKEVPVEGYIRNGEYYPLMMGDQLDLPLNGLLIPAERKYPSKETPMEVQQKILEYERKLAAKSGISFAIVHSEYLYNEKGEICIVESALRGGGVYISSHLIPYATGIDINEVLLSHALGENVDTARVLQERHEAASAYVCFCLREGVISEISGLEELKRLPFVKKVCDKGISVGAVSHKVLTKGMRYGPILVTAEDREELEKNIRTVQQTLKIKIDGTDGVIWE